MTAAVDRYNTLPFIPYTKHNYQAQRRGVPEGDGLKVTLAVRLLVRGELELFAEILPPNYARAFVQKVLDKISLKPKALASRALVERIILCADTLVTGVKDRKPLSYRAAFVISIAVEIVPIAPPLYVHNQPCFTRTFIIDKITNRIIILSKKLSLRQNEGASKKMSAAFIVFLDAFQSKQTIRLTNRSPEGYPLEFLQQNVERLKREIDLAILVNNDVYAKVVHENQRGQPKLTVVEEEYQTDLFDFLNAGNQLTAAQELSFLTQIAEKLYLKLHSQGIVHDDIKAGNVLLTIHPDSTITAKPTDFGWSYDLKERPNVAAVRQDGYGTSYYSSPESLRPELKLKDPIEQGKADDMYALGCLLYMLIFKAEGPWIQKVGEAIEAKNRALYHSLYDTQVQAHDRMKISALVATDPHRKKLCELCRDLLDPNPHSRMKVQQFLTKLKA